MSSVQATTTLANLADKLGEHSLSAQEIDHFRGVHNKALLSAFVITIAFGILAVVLTRTISLAERKVIVVYLGSAVGALQMVNLYFLCSSRLKLESAESVHLTQPKIQEILQREKDYSDSLIKQGLIGAHLAAQQKQLRLNQVSNIKSNADL